MSPRREMSNSNVRCRRWIHILTGICVSPRLLFTATCQIDGESRSVPSTNRVRCPVSPGVMAFKHRVSPGSTCFFVKKTLWTISWFDLFFFCSQDKAKPKRRDHRGRIHLVPSLAQSCSSVNSQWRGVHKSCFLGRGRI